MNITDFVIPPWARIAVPLLIAAAIFGAGYKVSSWHWSGKYEKAAASERMAISERDVAVARELQWRSDIKTIEEKMKLDAIAQESLQAAYEAAIARPPKVVVEYRDRWHTASETIVSHDCAEGVGELFTFLQSLPTRPQ